MKAQPSRSEENEVPAATPERPRVQQVESDLTDASLVLARELTDTGNRTDLDDAIVMFGFDRAELDAELHAELDAGKRA